MKRMGIRIKKRREMLNISLSKLAKDVGVSPSLLSQIENGKAFPSIITLKKISECLRTTVGELIGEKENLSNNLIINPEKLTNFKEYETGAVLYYLNEQLQDRFIDIYLIKLLKNGKIELKNNTHNTHDFFYVVEGNISLNMKEQNINLKTGFGYYNFLNIDKELINVHNSESRVLWIITTDFINLYHSIIEK